ncbi:MAG: acetolactate synthase small subunit [Verrucomicrobiales bacterium]|nr:acetolactate synthase small subunit [Verrucomicrobiales bacterium]
MTDSNIIPRHTISVLVENKFGVLARVAGMFSGRGYNIHSLNVAPSHDPKLSRMTITVREREDKLNQIIKQLYKLVDSLEVVDFREGDHVFRELVLIRIKADKETRPAIIELCDIFRAKIVDVSPDKITVEVTGNESKISQFITLMEDYEILDLTRTGKIVLPRANQDRVGE